MADQFSSRRRLRQALLASLASAALLAALPAQAAGERSIHLPGGSLEGALTALAAQTGEQLLYSPEIVAGRRVPPLSGNFDAEGALARLLASSNIVASRAGPKVIVLKARAAAATDLVRPTTSAQPREARPFADEAPRRQGDPDVEAHPRSEAPLSPNAVEEVRVTGTHIRGGSPAAPVLVLDRDALDRSGQTTLAAVLNELPQNFGGLNTEATAAMNADPQGSNITYATSINLRGLGSNATLVLVNGRRLSGSGISGDFADLSVLPSIAVSRVEVLLDGASAVYGSDAIGGVVNIILRRDLQGGEVRASAGVGDGGAPAEYAFGVVAGRRWSTGGVLAAYEAYQREPLAAEDRSYTAAADLRARGGTDWRITTAFPGNVVAVNPATGVSGPFFGIPAGQDGRNLRPADFLPGVVNRISRQLGQEILPEQRRQNLFAAVDQQVGDRLELSADVRYGFRIARAAIAAPTATLTVGRNNPFFVSPDGRTSHQIQYSFVGELPNPTILSSSESLAGSIGGRLRLPAGWAAESYAAFSQAIDETRTRGNVNTAILAEALGNVADRPDTAYSPGREGFFSPYTGLAANPASVVSALGVAQSVSRIRTRIYSGNIQADGPLFALPGGALQLAIGANARQETYLRGGSRYNTTAAYVFSPTVQGDRSIAAAFAEVRAPLVGDDNAKAGIARLELSAAVRGEWYSDFGHTLDPKVGVLWAPVADLRLRAAFGQSFRAPSLNQLLDDVSVTPFNFPVPGGTVLSLGLQGGNPDLTPETAKTWTAGFDYVPTWFEGARLSLTWFETDVSDRINRPVNENFANALTDPRFVNFVRRIDPANNAADLAAVNAALASPGAVASTALNPPTSYRAIVDARSINTGRLIVRGLDIEAVQSLDVRGGRLTLRAAASRLFDYKAQVTPTAPTFELLGRVGFPAKLRGRVSADWRRGAFGAGLAVNHTSALHTAAGVRIDEDTTVDASLRLEPERGPLAQTTLSLSIRNLFDSNPPFYDNPTGFAFDPANADVIGRFVTLRLARRW